MVGWGTSCSSTLVLRPPLPAELEGPRFQRIEKRVTALSMTAIPQSQQEEVVASKEINAINILAKLMTSSQPGGLSEKSAIQPP